VQSALGDVADDASSAFSSQVAGLQADVDALLAAARTAIADPSSAAVSGVRTAAGELADDVSAFAQDVASTC
jgi:hypothetical protein